MKTLKSLPLAMGSILLAVLACQSPPNPTPDIARLDSIPADIVKMTPELDLYPPILHSDEWEQPVPLPYPINTAGGEDSPFITPDGNTLYFFFTPDVRVPAEQQVIDGVTGIYVSQKEENGWSFPVRVLLQDPKKLSMDGCQFVQGNVIWFCSVRDGNMREIDFYTSEYKDGAWKNFTNVGERLNLEIGVGELHVTADGSEIYFHTGPEKEGGMGGYDLWVTRLVHGAWSDAENLTTLNTAGDEGWPFVSQDGSELWFLRTYQGSPALFRAKKVDGDWGEPELIVSQFAGEPSLDNTGNLYFVHHYYKDAVMLEADIYIAYRK
ncbi:MAG: hypothetical protein PVF83_18835 [Anaerolineales bacterium]